MSLWFHLNATGAKNDLNLCLCSDATGDVIEHTIPLTDTMAANSWAVELMDNGSALSSTINSVALYAHTDPGLVTVRVQNIIACKASDAADCLTHLSLIGKDTVGEPEWYPIDAIDGTAVRLGGWNDAGLGSSDDTLRNWRGTAETVDSKVLNPLNAPAHIFALADRTVQDDGTESAPIVFSGGWDDTDMSTQDGETWWSGAHSGSAMFSHSNRNFIEFERFGAAHFVGQGIGTDPTTSQCTVKYDVSGVVGCVSGYRVGAGINGSALSISRLDIEHIVNCLTGIQLESRPEFRGKVGSIVGCPDGILYGPGLHIRPPVVEVEKVRNNTRGLTIGSGRIYEPITVVGATFADNGSDLASGGSSLEGYEVARFIACTLTLPPGANLNSPGINEVCFTSQFHGGDPNDHRIRGNYSEIDTDTSVRHSESDFSWSLKPLSASSSTGRSSQFPVSLPLATLACNGGAEVTFKAWMRRSHANLNLGLRIKGGVFPGVGTILDDVESLMTAAADTWEEVTITFTPTYDCAVEIEAVAWGGSAYTGWVDDISVSQA